MALTATVHRLNITLSDVDRGVYEALELRLARHPSESSRYLWSRILAYCLSYEEGIAFSKGGLSDADEPPVSVRGLNGEFKAWIDVGSPAADRLHRASKAASRVALFSAVDASLLRKEAASRSIHHLDRIELWELEATLLDALAPHLEKTLAFELVRSEGRLYVTLPGALLESSVTLSRLDSP